jgi:hypothetical protein
VVEGQTAPEDIEARAQAQKEPELEQTQVEVAVAQQHVASPEAAVAGRLQAQVQGEAE